PFLGSFRDELLQLFDLGERDFDGEQVLATSDSSWTTTHDARDMAEDRGTRPASPLKRTRMLVPRHQFVKKASCVTSRLPRAHRRARRGCSLPARLRAPGDRYPAGREMRRAPAQAGASRRLPL